MQLTAGPINYSHPIFSRDGKTIYAIGSQLSGELLRYDLQRRELTPFLSGISADHVAFSPDKKWITYVLFPEGTLWSSGLDGKDPLQLTFSPLRAYLPRRSPEGKRILFLGRTSGDPSKMYTISADGGTPQVVISTMQAPGHDWLPSGDAILDACCGEPGQSEVGIHRRDLESGCDTKNAATDGLSEPSVPPSGDRGLGVDKDRRLFLVNLKTGERVQLTSRSSDYPDAGVFSLDIPFNGTAD